jgi:signal transduction histidine kinase
MAREKDFETIEETFDIFSKQFNSLLTHYKRKSKRLDKIIKQSDKQQFEVLKLNEELDKYKNHLEKMVAEKTKELKELNEHLEERVKKEVEANRQKDRQIYEQAKFVQLGELISNIAHQWRQPLNAISVSVSSMLAMKEMGEVNPQEEIEFLEQILQTTQNLSKTIEDFRNFANSEAKIVKFNLQKLLLTTINIIKANLDQNNIRLKINFPKNEFIIKSDPSGLSQAILNILKNAFEALIKTKKSDKIIYICLKEVDNDIVITIEDNGAGIKQEHLPKIFDPYWTTKHQAQGTGLGLYVARETIEKKLNGSIGVLSNNNKTVFIIKLKKD